MLPDAVRIGRDAMWWDYYSSIPANERIDAISVVHIRGALDHHRGYGCDSYDAIRKRVTAAMTGEDALEEARMRAYWADEGSPESIVPPATPPACVVLRIDSPGGVVSGLNETVYWLRRTSEKHGIPLVAYIDELGASAAYALACGCDEILLPASAIAGSVGVISTLYDQVEADKKMGINVVTLTSGARKADGHPHVPISQGALDAEQRRVDTMAKAFFQIVATARPLSTSEVRGYQAGIFMGREAVARGLADDVMGWDRLISTLQSATESGPSSKKQLAKPSQDESRSTGTPSAQSGTRENAMSLAALTNLIKRTEAALKSEKDPARKKTLTSAIAAHRASLDAMKKTKIKYEESTEEESAEEEEEAAEEESESAEEEEESSGNETDRDEEGDEPVDDDEDDEDAEEEEESSKKAASAVLALAEKATGRKGKRAIGALAAMIAEGQRATERVGKIEKEHRAERKEHSITAALTARRITPYEAKMLRAKSASFAKDFISMRKGAVVNVEGDEMHVTTDKKPVAGNEEASLPDHVRKSIDAAVLHASSAGVDPKALRAELVKEHVKQHEERMRAGLNGAGRY